MKRLILAIGLVVLTFAISIFSLIVVEKTNERMHSNLDSILICAKEKKTAALNEAVENTMIQWEKEKPLLNILIGQQGTNEITSDLKMIKHFSSAGDTDSLFLYIYECKTELERIKNTNEPSLSTIF